MLIIHVHVINEWTCITHNVPKVKWIWPFVQSIKPNDRSIINGDKRNRCKHSHWNDDVVLSDNHEVEFKFINSFFFAMQKFEIMSKGPASQSSKTQRKWPKAAYLNRKAKTIFWYRKQTKIHKEAITSKVFMNNIYITTKFLLVAWLNSS